MGLQELPHWGSKLSGAFRKDLVRLMVRHQATEGFSRPSAKDTECCLVWG